MNPDSLAEHAHRALYSDPDYANALATPTQWQGILNMRAEGLSVAGSPDRDAALQHFLNTLPADVGEVHIIYRPRRKDDK